MEYQINIQELFQQAFGLRRPVYVVNNSPQDQANISYKDVPTLPVLAANDSIKSSLGTAVLSPVLLENGNYKQRLADGRIITVEYAELLLPPTTIVEVNLKKVVVKTPLVSGQGTFKEYISFDDYDVRIRGVFVGNTLDDVNAFMRRLMEVWAVPKEVGVVCDYLDLLGVEALIIENITPQKLEGRPLMLPFEMTCISDKPLQLNFLGS
jgi:hypothetical protein